MLACCALAAAAQSRQAVFPTVTAFNLDKQKITLPGGMEGQIDLLVLSFAPEQQKAVDSWMPAAQAVQHTNFTFRYYEVPVLGHENPVFRWWETSSMRTDESDPESWRWIVPIFVDRQKFLHALGIPSARDVVVLLLDRQGHVLWRASGPLTPEKRAAMMQAAGLR